MSSAVTTLLLALLAGPSEAQPDAAMRTLGAPASEHSEPFSSIGSLRELSDGRVLVTDIIEERILVLDLRRGRATSIGRIGSGPVEFSRPGPLLPAGGDTTWMLDSDNARLVRIHPDGTLGQSFSLLAREGPFRTDESGTRVTVDRPRSSIHPQYIDPLGRMFEEKRVGVSQRSDRITRDSAAILRWDLTSGVADTLAWLYTASSFATATARPPGRVAVFTTSVHVPFNSRDAWAMGRDGSIAIVRAGEYHVEWITPDLRLIVGEPIPYERIRITESDREEAIGRTVAAAARAAERMPVDAAAPDLAPAMRRMEWPGYKPPFTGDPHVDPANRVWIPLTPSRVGDPVTYDVVDRTGRRVERVRMPPSTIIIGFGATSIYTRRLDDFDLQYLQRYDATWR